jgi:hypothetical protein
MPPMVFADTFYWLRDQRGLESFWINKLNNRLSTHFSFSFYSAH